MPYPKDRNIHRPPHIYLDGEVYFVTGRTVEGADYFLSEDRKNILKQILLNSIERFNVLMYAWVIVNNHYHLLFEFKSEEDESGRSDELSPNERRDELNPSRSEDEIRYGDKNNNRFPPYSASLLRGQSVTPQTQSVASDAKHLIVEFIKKINKDSAREINKLENKKGRRVWYQYREWVIKDEKDFYTHFNYIHGNPIKHGLVKNWEELPNYKFCSYNAWLNKIGQEEMGDVIRMYPVVDFSRWEN